MSACLIYMFLKKLNNYEYNLVRYIERICNIYKEEDIDKWLEILLNFSLNKIYHMHPFEYKLYELTPNKPNNIIATNDWTYKGDVIKNKIIYSHYTFLKTKFKYLDSEKIVMHKICNNWGLYDIIDNDLKFNIRNFINSNDLKYNYYKFIKKCDIIYWQNNFENSKFKESNNSGEYCIKLDAKNTIEIIFHIPEHQIISEDDYNSNNIIKINHLIKGCFASAIKNLIINKEKHLLY